MKINFKQIILLQLIIIFAVNSYFNNSSHNVNYKVKIVVYIALFITSLILFLFSIRQDKENAKKKLILAGAFVLISLMITYFYLNRV